MKKKLYFFRAEAEKYNIAVGLRQSDGGNRDELAKVVVPRISRRILSYRYNHYELNRKGGFLWRREWQ